MSDVTVMRDGSLVGLHVESEEALAYVATNVATEPWQWLGRVLWIDHRLAPDLIQLMRDDGLEIAG